MATYVILSRINPDIVGDSKEFPRIAAEVGSKLRAECPDVHWKISYALLGRFDVIDIVEADDPAAVERAVMIIRANGHAITETMPATPWTEFLENL